jgi:hypothetical protein
VAAVALGMAADYASLRAGYRLWWLLPAVVVAAMALSPWRGRGTPP